MILSEFLDRYNSCPLCNSKRLSTYILSNRKQSVEYIDDSLEIILSLRSEKNKTLFHDYKVGVYLSLKDNSFNIKYFDRYCKEYDVIPTYLINDFKKYLKNASPLKIYKECTSCYKFFTTTTEINLDLKKSIIDTDVNIDHFCFITKTDSDYKIIILNNFYIRSESEIVYWRTNDSIIEFGFGFNYPDNCSKLSLSLISFISKEKTQERINNLLIYS